MERSVRVERNRLRFAAAHMATFRGECEPLHGHNYDVAVTLRGSLTEDSWVWDFGDLKRITRAVAEQLDHRFILQRDSRVLTIEETATHWRVSFQDRPAYLFPKADVAALPVDNSTAERISEWMAGEICAQLLAKGATSVAEVEVEVEEMPGQSASFSCTLSRD
jgi:6-pyruvoyltetrahydropterin/6-carboxytetrahydropterin synthase